MSVAILLAEATLLPSVDLSLFSILIKSAHRHELLVQVFENNFTGCFLSVDFIAGLTLPINMSFMQSDLLFQKQNFG